MSKKLLAILAAIAVASGFGSFLCQRSLILSSAVTNGTDEPIVAPPKDAPTTTDVSTTGAPTDAPTPAPSSATPVPIEGPTTGVNGCATCDLVPCGYCQQDCPGSDCTYESSVDKAGATSRGWCGGNNAGLFPPACRPATPNGAPSAAPNAAPTDEPTVVPLTDAPMLGYGVKGVQTVEPLFKGLVLVTGTEGSGTTSSCRTLAHQNSQFLGLPTNWKLEELAPDVQQAHYRIPMFKELNGISIQILEVVEGWGGPYIQTHVDMRQHANLRIEQAAAALRALVTAARSAGVGADFVVFHLSMPFHNRRNTPFFDLAKISRKAGGRESHVVVTLRDVPQSLDSHGWRQDFLHYLRMLERMLREPEWIAPSQLHVLRHHELLSNPLQEFDRLGWDVLNITRLQTSPD